MRKLSLSLCALLVLVGAGALASAANIDVIGLDPMGPGYMAHTLSTGDYPAGSRVEAVMVVGGHPIIVDAIPVDPYGRASVHFPQHFADNRVDLRGPDDVVYATGHVGNYQGILELD